MRVGFDIESELKVDVFSKRPLVLMTLINCHLGGNTKFCYCPCCKQNAKWRKQHGLDGLIDKDVICEMFTVSEPLGMMAHLRKMGGVYEEKKDRKVTKIPMKCPYHYRA